MVCCFFGHCYTPDSVRPVLKNEILRILSHTESVVFYVGNHGNFDRMVRSVMKELIQEGKSINYAVVLAYMPDALGEFDDPEEYKDTLYPTGLESVPKRFAISWRNNWMVEQADMVICYIQNTIGGAYQFVEKAQHKNKTIINLYRE